MVRRAWLALGALVAVAVGGCTSTTAAPPSSDPLTTVANPSVVESSSSSVSSPTPSVVDPSELAPASAGGVSVAPLPAGLTAERATDAEAAIDVYRKYWAVSDEVGRNPDGDWSSQVSEVAIGSAADTFAQDQSYLKASGLRLVGSTSVQASVSKVEPALVHVTACVDVSSTDILDASGKSVGAPDGPGANSRFTTAAQVAEFEGGQWLVAIDQFDRSQTC